MDLLKDRHFPDDIKLLLPQQLADLAVEIRRLIIDTVSRNGGHLASNLGTVELTLALYRVFDFSKDKLLWDVGHQSYTHKILSGRLAQFHTLRQKGGLTGFPKRSESKYDAFGVGHASTALSAALGMAIARDLDKSDSQVIAVIGDGALTGGEAFEALNNIGALNKNLLIILNDNEMSISKNVGAMSTYLSRVRAYPEYNRLKKDFGKLLSSLPKVGATVFKTAEILKDSVRNACVAGALFEEMGLSYFGPIDGHDLNELIPMLQRVREIKGPVLLHIVTKKGKGYQPAENAPSKFHGIGKFNVEDGAALSQASSIPSYTQVFGETLCAMGEQDKDIVAITAAMAGGTGMKDFAALHPDRFFDVGIAEEHALTMAAGLAASGKKPFVALYSTFAQRGYDQIIHDICLQSLPVRLCLDRAGIVGEDGPTHHGVFDYSFLRQIPRMTVMAPKDEYELRAMLHFMQDFEGPISVRYPRGKASGVPMREDSLEYGKAEVLRQGSDALILAAGTMVYPALQAAQELAETVKIDCSVVNMRFIKPLDESLLTEQLSGKRALITIEENVLAGGFGAAVLEYLARKEQKVEKIVCIGIGDHFVTHGTRQELLEDNGLTAKQIAERIRCLWQE